MEEAVSQQLSRGIEIEHLAHCVLARLWRHLGVEALYRLTQHIFQHHLAKVVAPGVIRIRGYVITTHHAIARLGQPPQYLLF